MRKYSRPLHATTCFLVTLLVFWPAIHYPFLAWDDATNVVTNPHLSLTFSGLSWMLAGSLLGHWHPLSWLSLALDRAFWGLDPRGFHLTNILLHSLNAALFFLIAERLLKDVHAAAFAALFWALHPLRVESVAWISERRDVLSAALILASLLLWERGKRSASFALGTAAMCAKVFAVVLPGILLVWDARRRGAMRWKEKLPWLFPAGAVLLLNLRAQAQGAAVPWAVFGLLPRLAQAVYGLSFYPMKTLWPSGLGPLYERSLLLEPWIFIFAAAVIFASGLLIWQRRRNIPWLAQAALAYAVFLLPALGLFKSGRMSAADRYAYLPALPLSLLLGALLGRVPRAAGLTVLLILVGLTRRQLPVWNSDISLWTRATEVSPLSYFSRFRLAEALNAAGRTDEASAEMARARALHRDVFTRAAAAYDLRGETGAAAAARLAAARGPSFQ